MKKISELQKRWCEQYIKHYQGTRAAREAGYKESAAWNASYRNKKCSKCQMYIKEMESINYGTDETREVYKCTKCEEYLETIDNLTFRMLRLKRTVSSQNCTITHLKKGHNIK